jgi:hypothetical protein
MQPGTSASSVPSTVPRPRRRGFLAPARALALAVTLVLAPALAILAGTPGTAQATFPGRDGLITWSYSYQANEGPTPGGYGIRTVPARGGRGRALRSCVTFGYCEAWTHVSYSPDGSELAWQIRSRDDLSRVILGHADGTDAVTVGPGFGASFSPSGQRLVFIRRTGVHEQIVTRGVRASRVRVLLGVSGAADPQFSPDGRRILFARHTSVWIMQADGRHAHRILPNARAPSWAPSGQAIAYVSFRSGRVFTALPDGGHPRELPAERLCYPPACTGGSSFAVFSPDGRTIAFDDVDASGDPNVYTMPVAGGRARNVDSIYTDSAGGEVTGLTWQPLP